MALPVGSFSQGFSLDDAVPLAAGRTEDVIEQSGRSACVAVVQPSNLRDRDDLGAFLRWILPRRALGGEAVAHKKHAPSR